MGKIDVVKIVKIAGLVCTLAGSVASAWAGGEENKKLLEKLVADRLPKEE